MNEFDKTTKNIVILLLVNFVVLLIIGYFLRDTSFINGAFGKVPYIIYATGVLFGIVFSIIKVFMIRLSLTSALKKSQNKATLVSFGHFLTRYILTGIVLFIGIKNENIDFLGTMLGVLALQPASYMTGVLIKRDGDKAKIEGVEKELDI